ncbi:hypothetical protein G7K_3188-t1 [Saitoella complicata NRRL Y-17804]|uniref:Uncharacterized protein n=1 Tax=Saitoella complicata (strain BCRC 22490 / CBS 7301 / JCM 7358 / NBRC 10748 / NRRL Y-17804) TaxID=698492 RepID=A0A0E9NGM5_SAICN|nr:hypothetical protein G7K_3188-t1 [Saitoella complicata NRRL Y-17804]
MTSVSCGGLPPYNPQANQESLCETMSYLFLEAMSSAADIDPTILATHEPDEVLSSTSSSPTDVDTKAGSLGLLHTESPQEMMTHETRGHARTNTMDTTVSETAKEEMGAAKGLHLPGEDQDPHGGMIMDQAVGGHGKGRREGDETHFGAGKRYVH